MATRLGPVLLACAVLLAAPAVAQPAMVVAEFAEPAWATGEVAASGLQWAYLVFHGSPGAGFRVEAAPGSTVTNQTVLFEKRSDARVQRGSQSLDYPPQEASLPGGFEGRLGFPRPWGSLYVEADDIRIRQDVSESRLGLLQSGETLQENFPPVQVPTEMFHRHTGARPASLEWGARGTGPDAAFGIHLEVSGLHRAEWLNATLDCARGPCPDAGSPDERRLDALGTTTLQRLTFVDVRSPTGSIRGDGAVVAMVVGGASPDLGLAGRLRLPEARFSAASCPQGPCPDPAGRTFIGEGNVSLARLQALSERPARLQAVLSGGFRSAAFDEAPADRFVAAPVVVAGAVTLGLLVVLWKVALALFARSSRPPALQHPRRRELHGLICGEPGLSFRGLQRRLAWPTGTLQHHLRRLQDARLVVAEPYRNSVRYFENHGRYRDDWMKVVQLRTEDARRLHGWVAAHPGLHQTAIVAAAAAWGWTRARTLRRLAALGEAGLLSVERRGRQACYTASSAGVGP